jgi:WD40 repeat protein
MKHIILLILLTLGVWAQEVGVPFVPEVIPENTSNMITPKGTYISHLNYLEKKKLLIAGDSKGVVSFITLSPLQKIGEIKAHGMAITAMAVTPDEKYLITAEYGAEKLLKIWDTETFKLVGTLSGEDVAVAQMVVTPDSKIVITANQCGSLRWIEIASDRVVKKLHRYQIQGQYENRDRCSYYLKEREPLLKGFGVSHDGKKIALAYGYGEFIVNAESMKKEYELDLLFEGGMQGDFLFSPDDQSVMFSYPWDDGFTLTHPLSKYDLKSKKVTRKDFSFKDRLVSDYNQSRLVGYSKGTFNPEIDRLKDRQLLPPIKNTYTILSNLLLLNNTIAFGSENNSIYFYDFNKAELIAKIKFLDNGEWVAINAEGYFGASAKARNFIKVLQSTSKIETIDDQTFQKFNTKINVGDK